MPENLRDLLHALEQRLVDPGVRRERARLGELLAEDFREFGSSGRVFDREAILDLLASEPLTESPIAEITDFALTRLSSDAALVTYRATHPARTTLRCSIWVCRNDRWLLVFHQGTPASR